MARQLAQEGARLAICSRTRETLDAATAELRTYGNEVYVHRYDLTQKEQLIGFFDAVNQQLGPVDVLINMLLPNPSPDGQNSPLRQGKNIETPLTQSLLTTLTEKAAQRNNEMVQ